MDLIGWTESIELSFKVGEERPTAQDLADLLSVVYSVAQAEDDGSTIEANCAVVAMLSLVLPEVKALRNDAREGKINLSKLGEAVRPYGLGEKLFPTDQENRN